MKKIATLILTLFALVPAWAGGDDTLDRIEAAGSGLTSLEGSFSQARTIKASGKTSNFSGSFYFCAPDQLSMIYNEESEGLVLNKDKFFIRRGGKAHKGVISHNKHMEQLSSVLFDCVRGKVRAVAEANNATTAVSSERGTCVVTITAKKKSSKGFTRIVLRYSSSDMMLTGVLLEESSGTINEYKLSQLTGGKQIPASRFEIPKR